MSDRRTLGTLGEEIVARWAERIGWRVIARNWRCRSGELDLVVLDGETLVAVEVKVRSPSGQEPAEWGVHPRKAKRLLQTLNAFVAAYPEYAERYRRIDVVALTVDRRGRIVRWTHLPGSVTDDGVWE
ncbi:YraN family protein [Thermomicrobium sp. 4228-Ro]|uniref:YraN family protein n=1 Tax=Thermomicrobium sp. 4228-Ro TaxID=2993937 RepID=UPI0022488F9C|nr:YraN family protein [Thermomicrobium sp. 4228-Ro]MCX2727679.1 YraN family protein [Thermomicrobium sp. 4228-Ro]